MTGTPAPQPISPPGNGQHDESVAGEEDPGASLDMPGSATSSAKVATMRASASTSSEAPAKNINPGDDAPAGTPGTGEGICRDCGGSGKLQGVSCNACGGSGKVTAAVGGG